MTQPVYTSAISELRRPSQVVLVYDVTSESPESDKSGLSCVPGTSFKQECNWCYCLANGLPVCTRMGCPPPRHPGHNIFGTVGRMQPLGDLDYISPPL
ncbi:hypothetical protein J6590_055136 [Homalodisca vitripennis]|nr:hypothetical protein J6590_055136 [Homalodisca vitripennis]